MRVIQVNQMFRLIAVVLTLAAPAVSSAMDISWNGFGSFYYAQALNSEFLPPIFTNNHADFTHFSQIGLNLTGRVSDEVTAAAQIVGTGGNGYQSNFGLYALWANISWAPTDTTLVKLGRQLMPFWSASEYARVGYLLPYRTIPTVAYELFPFQALDGVSINQTFDVNFAKLVVGFFVGAPIVDLPAIPFFVPTFSEYFGGRLSLEGEGWGLFGQIGRVGLNIAVQQSVLPTFPASLSGNLQSYSLGYRLDKFNFVSWGEAGLVLTPDGTAVGTGQMAGRAMGGYVLVGYRLGNFMPRYTFAQNSERVGFADSDLITHTVGFNYSFTPQAVLKVEYEMINAPTPSEGLPIFQTVKPTDTSGSALYAGVDFIF